MVDGLNFKDFVAFLSAFSAKASAQQKIERMCQLYCRIVHAFILVIENYLDRLSRKKKNRISRST